MRNYFKALQLPVTTPHTMLGRALEAAADDSTSATGVLDDRHVADATAILQDETKRQVYANTVELYERLYEASACFASAPSVDSHEWRHRLADFSDMYDSADLL